MHDSNSYNSCIYIKQIYSILSHESRKLYILLNFLQGATIVDQIVSITPVENYVPKPEFRVCLLLAI